MYILSVTPEEVNILGEALDELPYKKVGKLVDNLRQQIAKQQPKPAGMGIVGDRVDNDMTVDPPEAEAA